MYLLIGKRTDHIFHNFLKSDIRKKDVRNVDSGIRHLTEKTHIQSS